MEKVLLKCMQCGKDYEKELSYYTAKKKGGNKNFYCSLKCSHRSKVGKVNFSTIRIK
jgi:hypothetical protein